MGETKAAITRFFRASTTTATKTAADTHAYSESLQAKGAITRFFPSTTTSAPEALPESLDSDPKLDQASETTGAGNTEVCTIETHSDQAKGAITRNFPSTTASASEALPVFGQ